MRQGLIKHIVERTSLAPVYRAARDEWKFARLTFAETPLGYQLAGPKSMQTGTFEVEEFSLIADHLESTDVFIDIGANVGYFTLLACSMGKQVIAIEPLRANLRYLHANIERNGWTDRVEVYPLGLSDKPGVEALYGTGTDASLVPGWSGASESFKRMVSVTTLDMLLGDRFSGKRMVVKMDIEGYEYVALQGASNLLKATPRPIWLVEITLSEHREGRRNDRFLQTFELLWDLGYRATAIAPYGKEISRAEVVEYENGGIRPAWATGNYLFSTEVSQT